MTSAESPSSMLVTVRRTGLLVGGWMAATALALVLGLLGVRAVSDSVTSSRPAALSPSSVKAALDRSSSTQSASSSSIDSAFSSASDAATVPSASSGSSSSSAEAPSATSPTSDDSDPPMATTPEDRTYQLVGGSVGVRFENGEAHLLWAQPNAGYSVDSSGSSSNVDIRFREISGDGESRLKAYWDDGPQAEIEER